MEGIWSHEHGVQGQSAGDAENEKLEYWLI